MIICREIMVMMKLASKANESNPYNPGFQFMFRTGFDHVAAVNSGPHSDWSLSSVCCPCSSLRCQPD